MSKALEYVTVERSSPFLWAAVTYRFDCYVNILAGCDCLVFADARSTVVFPVEFRP